LHDKWRLFGDAAESDEGPFTGNPALMKPSTSILRRIIGFGDRMEYRRCVVTRLRP